MPGEKITNSNIYSSNAFATLPSCDSDVGFFGIIGTQLPLILVVLKLIFEKEIDMGGCSVQAVTGCGYGASVCGGGGALSFGGAPTVGAAPAGKRTVPAGTIGNDGFFSHATGAEDSLYAQAGHENEARVKQRWGANYVNAVNLVERAYARNGMEPTGKEFVNHDKAIHFLSEMMDDPNTLKANQTRDYSRDGFMASVVDQALSMTATEPADIR
jgi:hypothetical protein